MVVCGNEPLGRALSVRARLGGIPQEYETMGDPIRYAVPYEVRILAHDLTTARRVSTKLYFQTQSNSGGPIPYGDVIPGTGDTTTLLTNFKALWDTFIGTTMSVKYVMDQLEMYEIDGYAYGTPYSTVINMAVTLTATYFTTASPHGFTTGDSVVVGGVTTPAAANGLWTNIVVDSPTQWHAAPTITGFTGFVGPGYNQKVFGQQGFDYESKTVLTDTTPGTIAGDAVALFADASIQCINNGVGKSWRQRISLAPIAESQVADGSFTAGAITTWTTALLTLYNGFLSMQNGGSNAGSKFMQPVRVSKKKALTLPTPFTTYVPWVKLQSSFSLHAYMGSQVKRKPKKLGSA